jgi:hypothetical protein
VEEIMFIQAECAYGASPQRHQPEHHPPVNNVLMPMQDVKLLNFSATAPNIKSKEKSSAAAKKLEQELSSELPQFMHTEIVYTLQRLLPADIKVIYVGPGENEDVITPNPFCSDWECTTHPDKGGVQVTPYITYNW